MKFQQVFVPVEKMKHFRDRVLFPNRGHEKYSINVVCVALFNFV